MTYYMSRYNTVSVVGEVCIGVVDLSMLEPPNIHFMRFIVVINYLWCDNLISVLTVNVGRECENGWSMGLLSLDSAEVCALGMFHKWRLREFKCKKSSLDHVPTKFYDDRTGKLLSHMEQEESTGKECSLWPIYIWQLVIQSCFSQGSRHMPVMKRKGRVSIVHLTTPSQLHCLYSIKWDNGHAG
jgi:hypothetical protein